MQTFLEEVITQISKEETKLTNAIFILPSKRSIGFLKRALALHNSRPFFSPKILSIEEFIEELSGLNILDPISLLFKSYAVYLNTNEFIEKDTFEEFSGWGQTVLNDFNEIDRYLVPTKSFFNYLLSIQTLEKWGVKNNPSTSIKKYLSFWEHLKAFYENLNNNLNNEQNGYQGMVYRKAAEDIEHYTTSNGHRKHYFLGFNALNSAEQVIIQELLETGNTQVFWDIDSNLLNNKEHAASLFINYYKQTWNYYKYNPLNISSAKIENNNITIVETENDIGQVKYIAQLLTTFSPEKLHQTAIVLADESLLKALLFSLPQNIENINITMGVPIKGTPEVVFFEDLISLYLSPSPYYYKLIESVLIHPLGSKLINKSERIIDFIKTNNISNVSFHKLKEISGSENLEAIDLLFGNKFNSTPEVIDKFLIIIKSLLNKINASIAQKIILSKIENIFIEIKLLSKEYDFIKTPQVFKSIFDQLLSKASLDYEGNPESGLQIMGILETRVIDFENIILLSANEGTLPSGKSNTSFITYDLKQQYNLPKFTEKDAVYAYHFYHLLFRSKNSTLVYSNQPKGLGSNEKSRFLLQLEVDPRIKKNLKFQVQSSTIDSNTITLKQIHKTEEILSRLEEIASKGFSPSSITSYIRNPLDFYYERILQINELNNVEETIEHSTLGVIVHEALEKLYKPFVGKPLTAKDLTVKLKEIESEVIFQFQKHFKDGNFSKGKNLIIFEIAKRYIENLIKLDIDSIKNGSSIKILALEKDLKQELIIPGINFPLFIKGTVDRVDLFNNQLRIIDYKTGKVEQKDLDIIDWEDITEDYKYSKAFQVLAYAFMYKKEYDFDTVSAGIISFKNLQSGFINFRKKDAPRAKGNENINTEVLNDFEFQLIAIIKELLDKSIPFTEKEV